jgi:hypothetical protein
MKSARIFFVLAVAVASLTGLSSVEASCCTDAKKAGKACAHECCIKAAKAKKSCEKCNPKKEKPSAKPAEKK